MESSAAKVLQNIANCENHVADKASDKDWDFCKFLYHKLRAIPEGNLKDELQLDIQRLIRHTKRQSATAVNDISSTVILGDVSGPRPSYQGFQNHGPYLPTAQCGSFQPRIVKAESILP